MSTHTSHHHHHFYYYLLKDFSAMFSFTFFTIWKKWFVKGNELWHKRDESPRKTYLILTDLLSNWLETFISTEFHEEIILSYVDMEINFSLLFLFKQRKINRSIDDRQKIHNDDIVECTLQFAVESNFEWKKCWIQKLNSARQILFFLLPLSAICWLGRLALDRVLKSLTVQSTRTQSKSC